MKFIVHPIRSAHHKGSVVYRLFHEAMTGTNWRGQRLTTLSELMGFDDKGYYETTTKTHKKGEPKGGKLAGQVTAYAWGGKKGPIGISQVPSYLIHEIRGVQPIQVQNLLGWIQGEIEGFDAIARSLGLHTGSTYPKSRKAVYKGFVDEYIASQSDREHLLRLRSKVMEYNISQREKGEPENTISWKKVAAQGRQAVLAKERAQK